MEKYSLLNTLLTIVARNTRQDDSLHVLNRLITQGYTHGIWHIHEDLHHEADICDAFNGQEFNLIELTSNLQHAAPIFEKSHVNCYCWLYCYSRENPNLNWVVVDWKGEGESGRRVDRNDPKERKREFQELYQQYVDTLQDLDKNKFLTGRLSDPEAGIYSFDMTLYDEDNFDFNQIQKLDNEILEIILNQATQYKIPINDAHIEGMEYVFTSNPISIYEFTLQELREIAWRFNKRSPELQGVIADINRMKDFLIFTQNKINEKLQQLESQTNVIKN